MKRHGPLDRFRSAMSTATIGLVKAAGSPGVALLSVLLVVAWLVAAVALGFAEHWVELLFGVSAAATFVMSFLILHTSRRNERAVMMKLDELIHVTKAADDEYLQVENRPLDEQEDMERERPGGGSGD
ncbi:low affinity Fe/Cu permease [Stackebrandtia albiflava]|uniref:Low affinity Fe/Cu permease n=1 Tax=Stackebrandtia albiflava TaxID=406432 RepID=A0A562V9K3_9ACTN|nr:low affinity iron permease family protein [Stackebrandtia albiflava]TWJ14550.1 low affinity Fe/Cu permease [Stackebrandtia albiflava]